MSFFSGEHKQSPLLRIVVERELDCDGFEPCNYDLKTGKSHELHEHDGWWNLVSVERVDGLIELTRTKYGMYDYIDLKTGERHKSNYRPWNLSEIHAEGGYVNWFRSDWDNIGFDTIKDVLEDSLDLERVERIVLTGLLWSYKDYWGEYDSGFDVETIEAVVYKKRSQPPSDEEMAAVEKACS